MPQLPSHKQPMKTTGLAALFALKPNRSMGDYGDTPRNATQAQRCCSQSSGTSSSSWSHHTKATASSNDHIASLLHFRTRITEKDNKTCISVQSKKRSRINRFETISWLTCIGSGAVSRPPSPRTPIPPLPKSA